MKKIRTSAFVVLILVSMVMIFNCAGTKEGGESIKFYVGSSDRNLEYSIFLCELDPGSGTFSVQDSFAGARVPNYLAFSPDRKYLYTISDVITDSALNHMSVSAFSINQETHQIEFLNSQSSEGNGPCHLICSQKGDYLFVANYSSGHVAAYPIAGNGTINPASSVVLGSGSGPVENRQEGPHAHQVILDPEERFLLVPDLGTDQIMSYQFDRDSGVLRPNPTEASLAMYSGSGPRHLVFHPSGEYLYVANELNSTVTACRYHNLDGTMLKMRMVNTVPESHEGSKYPAAIRIHPSGNFVYASTRGDVNCISVFRVGELGDIFRIQVVEGVPDWPRDFNIDPSGAYLLVAGERSDEIGLYMIDKETGRLSSTQSKFKLPSPGCILYID